MKKKTKEIKLPMRFDPGKQKYEPVLPVLRKGKEIMFKDAWQWLWVILIAIAVGLGFWLLMRKGWCDGEDLKLDFYSLTS